MSLRSLISVLMVSVFMLNCATFRMSDQKVQEIKGGSHGTLSIKVPDGKAVDGYDEKWKLDITIDGSRVVRDNFIDSEEYSMPLAAGERDVIINLRREVNRPFRSAYVYYYPQFIAKKVTIPEKGTVKLTFDLPEKKFGVGMFVFGIIFPIVAIIGWPSGGWPAFNAEAKPTYVTEAIDLKSVQTPNPKKRK